MLGSSIVLLEPITSTCRDLHGGRLAIALTSALIFFGHDVAGTSSHAAHLRALPGDATECLRSRVAPSRTTLGGDGNRLSFVEHGFFELTVFIRQPDYAI